MAETTRTRQLKQLANNLPNVNQDVAAGLNAARQTQLQEQVKQLRPGQAATGAAQQLGAQQTAQAAQISQQMQQERQAQASQIGQRGLQEKQLESEQRLGMERRNLSELGLKNARLLNDLQEDAKDEIIDRQLQFQRDESGRALLNERQLHDFAIVSAKNDEELKDYAQAVQGAYNKKALMYQTAAAKLKQGLAQSYTAKEQQLDQQSRARVQAAIQEAERKARKARNKASGFASAMTAVGTIGGAVVGAVYGGPAGAVVGAQAGGAVGTYVGGAANPA